MTITDKNNNILSIDTWKDGGLPMTKDKVIKGLSRSGITPPKGFLELL
ncbi:hypothetical protein LW347_00325 [Pectobacterium polonicum]|uniref:Uncharacterized protein n=1 Tax=Pectobacterium polonicum TaxID=2485124 RepID=A0AAE9T1M3_9GAMM|nr:hypothetical protein [Pectobacterium polonicum]UVO08497.1 hypothetical protein LW347_00325 [Pectobacterium polonicum]